MPETITLNFTNTKPETVAAMIKGGAAAGQRYRDLPHIVLSYTALVLIAGGGAFVSIGIWVFALDRDDNLVWLLPLGVIAAGIIGLMMFRRMVHAQARMTLGSAFGRAEQEITFDAQGLRHTNAHAVWRTNWTGVEFIHATRHGLSITISGIVVPIPNAAFDGDPHKIQVCAQLTTWHEAAQ